MRPLLSIIIPCYNHQQGLPALLDSVAAQDFTDYEVIIVDDCSDGPYLEMLRAEAAKRRAGGMELRLVRNPSRLYTKESRLLGVEAARGDYIMCADADDRLAGRRALRRHMEMLLSSKADLLQFPVLMHDETRPDSRSWWHKWTMPWPDRLEGRAIFETYVKNKLVGHTVWGKIARRSLWLKCLEPARRVKIRRYQEDLLLSSLLFLHARSLLGSRWVGYEGQYVNKDAQKACGRAVAQYFMLTQFLPYAADLLGSTKTGARALRRLHCLTLGMLRAYLQIWLLALWQGRASVDEIEQHIELDEFVRVIAAGGLDISIVKARRQDLPAAKSALTAQAAIRRTAP